MLSLSLLQACTISSLILHCMKGSVVASAIKGVVSDLDISGPALKLKLKRRLKPPSVCFPGLNVSIWPQLTDMWTLSLCLCFLQAVLPLFRSLHHPTASERK